MCVCIHIYDDHGETAPKNRNGTKYNILNTYLIRKKSWGYITEVLKFQTKEFRLYSTRQQETIKYEFPRIITPSR